MDFFLLAGQQTADIESRPEQVGKFLRNLERFFSKQQQRYNEENLRKDSGSLSTAHPIHQKSFSFLYIF